MRKFEQTFNFEDGQIQKVFGLSDFSWDEVSFCSPTFTPEVLTNLSTLFETYIFSKPAVKETIGTLVFFCLDKKCEELVSLAPSLTPFGKVLDPQIRLSLFLNYLSKMGLVSVKNNKLVFENKGLEETVSKLQELGLLKICGEGLPLIFVPINPKMGFPSSLSKDRYVCNSSFFLMELTDIATPYDIIGTPIGLMVQNSKIFNPPLFDREAFAVSKEGSFIFYPSLNEIKLEIQNIRIDSSQNGVTYYSRPNYDVTPKENALDLVIVNSSVVAIKEGGLTNIPMAGFVVHITDQGLIDELKTSIKDEAVEVGFSWDRDLSFAIQVGPKMTENTQKSASLTCPFYKKEGIVFPPSVYPLNFDSSRASRIIIGETEDNKPTLLWLEGAGKLGHIKGLQSCGSSLSESVEIASSLNLKNSVNLDGGGSAQIVKDYQRPLKIADRKPQTNEESERPVPMCLVIGK